MNKLLLLLLALTSMVGYAQTNENATNRFSEILSHANQYQLSKASTIPEFIEFANEKEPTLQEIPALLNSFVKKPFTLKEISREID